VFNKHSIVRTKYGLSCHCKDLDVIMMAVAMGAEYIEVHITNEELSEQGGRDHEASYNYNECKVLNDKIKKAKTILGKKEFPEELPKYLQEQAKHLMKEKVGNHYQITWGLKDD
jgi:sialic acid synthase SpsE